MPISFLGHSPSFQVWAFNINGRRALARNYSTPSPLSIRFSGAFDDAPVAGGLIKTSGFDITDSTDKNVIWTWGGKRYTSNWELNDDDPENITIQFGTPVPYTGSPVAPVGTSVKTKDEREAAEALAITPAAKLSTEPPVVQSPAPAPKTTTVSPTGPNVQFANKTKEDIEASTAYKTPDTTNRTPVPSTTPPVVYTPPVTGTTKPPAPGTKDAREAAEAAAGKPTGTDWVKLGLQLGAAYLLLS